jgi:spoIIIJ-associated protein
MAKKPTPIELVQEFLEGLLEYTDALGRAEASWYEGWIYVGLRGKLSSPEEADQLRSDLTRVIRLYLRAHGASTPVIVDVNGRWSARREELTSLARRAAERAIREGKKVKLRPMPPEDRRVIHLALADFPGVRTYSVGKGNGRRVVVEPENARP